ncbi:hypothetical protein BC833DRAFT_592535 [Globomyces pollinis-pini]|nr:hypothetical protein BC833DRAFT_592535 [Globomyces pollinis-pini]
MEGPLQILKEESLKVKELIGNIKIKPTKNQDKNPLPIHIYINISQPDDALAYDINEIKLEIIITQLEPAQLLVKVDPQLNGLPIELSTAMEKMIQKQWDYSLMKKNNQEFISWMFPEIMKWVKLRFVKIISCVPDCLESYLGTSAAGESMRRYAVIIKSNIISINIR